jgi:hypothetical protein
VDPTTSSTTSAMNNRPTRATTTTAADELPSNNNNNNNNNVADGERTRARKHEIADELRSDALSSFAAKTHSDARKALFSLILHFLDAVSSSKQTIVSSPVLLPPKSERPDPELLPAGDVITHTTFSAVRNPLFLLNQSVLVHSEKARPHRPRPTIYLRLNDAVRRTGIHLFTVS